MALKLLTAAAIGLAALAAPAPARAAPREAAALRLSAPGLAGFYVNGFAGAAVIDSTVRFAATPTRPAGKFVDQGGDGLLAGLRLGWGRMAAQHLYYGAELEGMYPYNVQSRLMAYGSEYRARLRSEVGLYARLGWSWDGASLVFARAGLSMPRQLWQSTQSERPRNSADWSVVPQLSIGAEVPLWDRLAWRIDLGYSVRHGENRLETYRLNAGLTWRF